MRPAAAALLAAALIACSPEAAPPPAPSATLSAESAAADLRVHRDLLLGEHVMIVAKESEAALYHSDEYGPYTTLLGANSADLSALVGRALGSTTAGRFAQLWNMQNGYLVDYAIGVDTHDDAKASAAMTGLRNQFQPQLAQLFAGFALGDQLNADKAFIDDLFAQNYPSFYSDLHTAYSHSRGIGDPLADEFVKRFPDKFPGQTTGAGVDKRVTMNLVLQEHSYLSTMATDAAIAKREAEKSAASSALARNAPGITWSRWDSTLIAYATGGDLQGSSFVVDIASATGASQVTTQFFIVATIKVLNDQKAQSYASLAGDDRAAATATQPIADASVQR